MKLPSLRRPVGASVLAGVCGAGLLDLVADRGRRRRRRRPGAGARALRRGSDRLRPRGELVVDAIEALDRPAWRSLRAEPERDRAVAAGILAALLAMLVVAVVAAAGQAGPRRQDGQPEAGHHRRGGVGGHRRAPGRGGGDRGAPASAPARARLSPPARARRHRLPCSLALAAAGRRWRSSSRCRAPTGGCSTSGRSTRSPRRSCSARAWPVLVLLAARQRAAGAAPGGARPGIAARDRVIAAAAGLAAGARLPEGSPALEAVADHGWGLRALLATARHLTDHDGDGFSARFGGGDCDDTRADVYPGAEDIPGDGIDQDCEGGDAKPVAAAPKAAASDGAPLAPIRPRADGFKGNILIVTIDAFRADRLGVAGYSRPPGHSLTPTLDALAARGAYFRRVWSQAPNTPRSFPSIVTGRYPTDIAFDKPTVNYPNLLPANQTVFQILAATGLKPIGIFSHFYFTADRGISRGFAEWSNDGAGTIAESNKDSASPRIVPRVIERLKTAAAKHERFVLWTHLFEPHSSYMPHKEFPLSLSGVPGLMEKYDYEIAFADLWVKKLFDEVKALGLDKNTAIIVCADHGEAWGEHKEYFHGTDLFDEQTRVPLIIAIPGQGPRVINDEVELVDVAPTLLDLVGAPIPVTMSGRSLLPLIDGEALPPAPIFAEQMPATAWPHQAAMMVDGDHKLIHRISDRRWELYDLKRDPGEKTNLAASPADAALFEALRAKLVTFEERSR